VIVGCPKEVKNNENRVGLTPGGVWALSQAGHTVLIENSAGAGSHFSDDEYRGKGAEVVDSASEVWTRSEMVVKVKEPLPSEYGFFRDDLVLFAYQDPVYYEEGILHYAVANMPGAYPRTSTLALTNVTLKYVLDLANKGVVQAAKDDHALRLGINTWHGRLTYAGVAESQGLPWQDIPELA